MSEPSPVQPTDEMTTMAELRSLVNSFVEERNWRQFHSPKNLAMSLAIEAGELMEHFQWLTTDESRQTATDERRRAEVAEELADVLAYALALANEMGIDLSQALRDKMLKNARKYPVEEFRGRFGPDDVRPVS
jgi:dCTP diphosphatase